MQGSFLRKVTELCKDHFLRKVTELARIRQFVFPIMNLTDKLYKKRSVPNIEPLGYNLLLINWHTISNISIFLSYLLWSLFLY